MKRQQRPSSNNVSPSTSPQPKKKQKIPPPASRTMSGEGLHEPLIAADVNTAEDGSRDATANGRSNPANDGEGDWAKVERRKEKKKRNQALKIDSNPAVFKYLVGGLKNRRESVTIDNIRDFTLSVLSDVTPQPWIIAENPRAIKHVVALFIPGILPSHIGIVPPSTPSAMPLELPRLPLPPPQETFLPILHTLFSHACPTKAPGETSRMYSVLAQFLQCPLTGEEQRKQQERRIQLERQQNLSPSDFVLTYALMKENDYPIPTYLHVLLDGNPFSPTDDGEVVTRTRRTIKATNGRKVEEGWVETPEMMDGEPMYAMLALDCEMCETVHGQELTRISVIDTSNNTVIYDKMVMPDTPIIDYLTRYSGVTARKLEGVTTTLADVQKDLLTLLHPRTILLGHSLENDLRALKLAHPRCADTSVLYHHPRGAPYKPGLKWLAQKWLGKEIQKGDGMEGEHGGHDPEEDARTCAELFQLKMKKGLGFGEFQQDIESIFEKLARPSSRRQSGATAAVVDHGNPATWHGAKAKTSVACKTDEEVVQGIVDTVPTHDFVFARFMELSNAVGWTTPKNNTAFPMSNVERCASPPDHPPSSEDSVRAAFTALNDRLTRLHRSLPRSTAIVLMTGHADPRGIVQLNVRRSRWEAQYKLLRDPQKIAPEDWWTTDDDRKLALAVEKAKHGLAFFCITRQTPLTRPVTT